MAEGISLEVLTAAFSDEAKGRRVAELLETLNQVEEARKKLAAEQAKNDATLAKAEQMMAAAKTMKEQAEASLKDTVEKNRALEDAITGLGKQKEEFMAMRSEVEQAHRDKASALADIEQQHSERETAVAGREAEAAGVKRKLEEWEQDLKAREGRLAEIVAAISPKAD